MLSATRTGGFNSIDQLSSVGIKHIRTDTTPNARITGVLPNGDKRFIFKRTSKHSRSLRMGELGDLVSGYSGGEAKLKMRRRGRLLRFVRFFGLF